MSKNTRVRFAPSPTGGLHIGGLRTALFNYLFAKQNQGTFVLRIEDTDQSRFVEGAEKYIIEALEWCGIPFDEGPGKENESYGSYRQSERRDLYKKHAEQLIASGHAYYAFDTTEALEAKRKQHEREGKTFIYNWHNRLELVNSLSLTKEETQEKIDSGAHYVIRFKSPENEILHLQDLVRGHIEVNTNTLDDKVLFKNDGLPTYHLANVVDDYLMDITHVIRGEEWLPSLALHYQLYHAFGWNLPEFAHLPLILKPTGKGKLSKRDGDKLGFPVFPLAWKDPKTEQESRGYKEDGYFPEAVINFLAFLGWNPGTEQEIFSLEELINTFHIGRVNKAGARFDPQKIKWFNHQYMQMQDDMFLAETFLPELQRRLDANIDINYVHMAVRLVKERASFISDLWALTEFFFLAPKTYDEKAVKKAIKADTKAILNTLLTHIKSIHDFDSNNIKQIIHTWITDQNMSFGKVMMPLRLALVGALKGPDVFDIMFMIGKNETIKRIESIINYNISSIP